MWQISTALLHPPLNVLDQSWCAVERKHCSPYGSNTSGGQTSENSSRTRSYWPTNLLSPESAGAAWCWLCFRKVSEQEWMIGFSCSCVVWKNPKINMPSLLQIVKLCDSSRQKEPAPKVSISVFSIKLSMMWPVICVVSFRMERDRSTLAKRMTGHHRRQKKPNWVRLTAAAGSSPSARSSRQWRKNLASLIVPCCQSIMSMSISY